MKRCARLRGRSSAEKQKGMRALRLLKRRMVPSRLGSSRGMGWPWRASYSSITWRQAPQGRAGPNSPSAGPGGYGHAHNGRVARLRGGQAKQGRALGAEAAGVSSVFLIGAPENSAIGQQQGGPHMEAGIRRVGVRGGIAGGLPGGAFGGGEVGGGVQLFEGNELLAGNAGHADGIGGVKVIRLAPDF